MHMRQRNYINNRELYSSMIKYLEDIKINKNTQIPNYIGESILLICNNLSRKPNFSRYTYKQDMVSDAIRLSGLDHDKFVMRGLDYEFADPADLIISTNSWGLHYPVDIYL